MTLDETRQAIRAELESLRAAGTHRRDLSLHACKRLFFDLGIRPTMATVRDLTQTGSASDIPKDIEHFWERIREASKVRIGAGSIPKVLEEKAGELLGALYEQAAAEARLALDTERLEVRSTLEAAERSVRDANVRREASEEALRRSELRAEQALARVRELEAKLASASTQGVASQTALETSMARLEAENEKLRARVDAEQATNAALRDRIDALHGEMRQNAEHYAAQIKDAVADAERRVKPMLVELDALRSMATTYQTGIRDASRKEFDFIQQLSAAKGRADRLETQVRNQSDEIDALTRELDALRMRGAVSPELATVVDSLAAKGRLGVDDFATMGTLLDACVTVPSRCPKCTDGEPELAQAGEGFELVCPECDHASGVARSRLEVVTRFSQVPVSSVQE